VEILSGALLAQLRFQSPSPGIWRIRAQNKTFVDGTFHLWLPITGLVDPAVRFYTPNVDTTLVIPSCAESVLTCSTYNAYNNSLYIHSGRGYTRNGRIKPDFASPGVNLTAPSPGSAYQLLTGSCAAAALTAGAVALLIEGGLSLTPPRLFTAQEIKSLFLRGTRRSSTNTYPNREWGYGTLNLFGIFESFLRS
jgi:subtilisin family serine protease